MRHSISRCFSQNNPGPAGRRGNDALKNEGWTLSELAGELMEYGIDIADVSPGQIDRVLDQSTPERAAAEIARDY